ncbi:MAG: hypothetical protein LBT91_03770 [Bifidobacteriaceae bacterium]|jgi:hypothetical protein|nr:hypothetical protein [Bifidobacteriaceae bacterium]
MNINKNELFKSEKIWPPNIIFPKKQAFKRLGVLGIIFLFGTAAFISGFSINSYAASSSTVLPIARGGTNANTAAQASSNILGSNFANYNGVLPVAKGGTNAGTVDMAKNNLQIPAYPLRTTYCSTTECASYDKVTENITSFWACSSQSLMFSGSRLRTNQPMSQIYVSHPVFYLLSSKCSLGLGPDEDFEKRTPSDAVLKDYFRLISLEPDCVPQENIGFIRSEGFQTEEYAKVKVSVFLHYRGNGFANGRIYFDKGYLNNDPSYIATEQIPEANKPESNREEGVVIVPLDMHCSAAA